MAAVPEVTSTKSRACRALEKVVNPQRSSHLWHGSRPPAASPAEEPAAPVPLKPSTVSKIQLSRQVGELPAANSRTSVGSGQAMAGGEEETKEAAVEAVPPSPPSSPLIQPDAVLDMPAPAEYRQRDAYRQPPVVLAWMESLPAILQDFLKPLRQWAEHHPMLLEWSKFFIIRLWAGQQSLHSALLGSCAAVTRSRADVSVCP
jgi:hypothetical protein